MVDITIGQHVVVINIAFYGLHNFVRDCILSRQLLTNQFITSSPCSDTAVRDN